MYSILFLCTGNSARSQLAEALFRQAAGDQFQVFSAGTDPDEVDARVYRALKLQGITASDLKSKTVEELSQNYFDYVITLCDKASRECAAYPESQALVHWDLSDPRPESGLRPFLDAVSFLEQKITEFLQLGFSKKPQPEELTVQFFKILSDKTRLRTLMLIEDEKELCVTELVDALDESQPKVSRHLAQLREVGVLEIRRQGQMIFYRLADELPQWCRKVLEVSRIGNPALINQEKIRLKQSNIRSVCCPKESSDAARQLSIC
ncbi:phosphotyrosine protein phosphatase [Endozoicomonas sp. OPT23]|uniref:metalloregulator ArsR/SmtB family transcription factor n=1 Tax=Endozoicomonas sp. OPT23 TaxID=2072845 RepID=UPI00129B5495|nr:metalloregulator ArsR/SmtB family transcription factor [Endozoicomonas sp. OPT23]MRI32920.1 phosphotyrosine protein phosphatase [Endozoicomonas sp. OPT23]